MKIQNKIYRITSNSIPNTHTHTNIAIFDHDFLSPLNNLFLPKCESNFKVMLMITANFHYDKVSYMVG